MSDNLDTPASNSGYTSQGQMVAEHWERSAVTYEGAIESLRLRGIEPDKATSEDLHALDMLHMGGRAATDSLAAMAKVGAGQKVLDVGSGVGGPARRMASKFQALVWGVELSEALYQTAIQFTELVGLGNRVQFKQGSALALPFSNGEFDGVVMQHVAMQIAEKDQLFSELTRVIRSGGFLAMHELFGGEEEEPQFPLPWATEPAMSSLESLESCSARLRENGFEVGQFVDLSEDGRQFHEERIIEWTQVVEQQRSTAGLSVEATESRLRASEAMELNLRTGRVRVGMLVCKKKGN